MSYPLSKVFHLTLLGPSSSTKNTQSFARAAQQFFITGWTKHDSFTDSFGESPVSMYIGATSFMTELSPVRILPKIRVSSFESVKNLLPKTVTTECSKLQLAGILKVKRLTSDSLEGFVVI